MQCDVGNILWMAKLYKSTSACNVLYLSKPTDSSLGPICLMKRVLRFVRSLMLSRPRLRQDQNLPRGPVGASRCLLNYFQPDRFFSTGRNSVQYPLRIDSENHVLCVPADIQSCSWISQLVSASYSPHTRLILEPSFRYTRAVTRHHTAKSSLERCDWSILKHLAISFDHSAPFVRWSQQPLLGHYMHYLYT